MDLDIQLYEKLQQYLDNKLAGREKEIFEEELDSNKELYEQYCFELEVSDSLEILLHGKDIISYKPRKSGDNPLDDPDYISGLINGQIPVDEDNNKIPVNTSHKSLFIDKYALDELTKITPVETVADLKEIKGDFIDWVSLIVNNELDETQKKLYSIEGLDYINELFKERKVKSFYRKFRPGFTYGLSPEDLLSQVYVGFVDVIVTCFTICLNFYSKRKKNESPGIEKAQLLSEFKMELIKAGVPGLSNEAFKKYGEKLVHLVRRLGFEVSDGKTAGAVDEDTFIKLMQTIVYDILPDEAFLFEVDGKELIHELFEQGYIEEAAEAGELNFSENPESIVYFITLITTAYSLYTEAKDIPVNKSRADFSGQWKDMMIQRGFNENLAEKIAGAYTSQLL